jgi:L-lactate dehydrogenase complex protein LldG
MSAKAEILGRIRAATANASPPDTSEDYRRAWKTTGKTRLARLTKRLEDYGVTVLQAESEAEIAELAERQLAARRIGSLLIPADLPPDWRPGRPEPVEDKGEGPHRLDRFAGVMTGCALAIAETGTIVLDAGAAQGRRAITLVPDYYLCVVLASQVVGIVPEAIAQLAEAAKAGRPITFISGPSATADIELDRVAGVHGPRRLDVILVG